MRMLDGKVVWVNPQWAADESLSADVDLFEVFRKRFACMIPNAGRFASLRFDHSAPVQLLAERYGGCGIGYNGGGVRCGNLGNYQIKGIGRISISSSSRILSSRPCTPPVSSSVTLLKSKYLFMLSPC